MIHLQALADNTLGAGNLGIKITGANAYELSAEVGKKRLEAQPLFYFGLLIGL